MISSVLYSSVSVTVFQINVPESKAKKAAILYLKRGYAFSGFRHYLYFVMSVTTYLAIIKMLQKLKQKFLLLLSCFMQLQVSKFLSLINPSYN